MSSQDRKVTLDASAVLAFLLRERGHQTVDRLLSVAVVPASAMVETLYRAVEKGYRGSPSDTYGDLLALGVIVEPVTAGDTVRAAELIVTSKQDPAPGSLSLGDGLCISVAERLGLPMTGGDRYWSHVGAVVEFLPFR